MKKSLTVFLTVLISLSAFSILTAAQAKEMLIRNVTIMTAAKGTLEGTDILIQNGKIARIGKNLQSSGTIVDGTGKFVTPGIIDAHSHTMLDAINEGSLSVTSMTNVRDMLDTTDVAIYRALAGGVTSALLLHGSANSIGGLATTVKFKWGKPVEDYVVADALPANRPK